MWRVKEESCHVWGSHVTCELGVVAHMNEWCHDSFIIHSYGAVVASLIHMCHGGVVASLIHMCHDSFIIHSYGAVVASSWHHSFICATAATMMPRWCIWRSHHLLLSELCNELDECVCIEESCHIWRSRVTYEWVNTCNMNESRHTWMSHVTHEWVTSHIWMRHVCRCLCVHVRISQVRHDRVMPHINESRHTWMSHVMYKWVMSLRVHTTVQWVLL